MCQRLAICQIDTPCISNFRSNCAIAAVCKKQRGLPRALPEEKRMRLLQVYQRFVFSFILFSTSWFSVSEQECDLDINWRDTQQSPKSENWCPHILENTTTGNLGKGQEWKLILKKQKHFSGFHKLSEKYPSQLARSRITWNGEFWISWWRSKELVPFTQLVKLRRGQLVLALPNIWFSWNFYQIISGTKYE